MVLVILSKYWCFEGLFDIGRKFKVRLALSKRSMSTDWKLEGDLFSVAIVIRKYEFKKKVYWTD
jgi:hypothetical protein